jgi:hypothetical protein
MRMAHNRRGALGSRGFAGSGPGQESGVEKDHDQGRNQRGTGEVEQEPGPHHLAHGHAAAGEDQGVGGGAGGWVGDVESVAGSRRRLGKNTPM